MLLDNSVQRSHVRKSAVSGNPLVPEVPDKLAYTILRLQFLHWKNNKIKKRYLTLSNFVILSTETG